MKFTVVFLNEAQAFNRVYYMKTSHTKFDFYLLHYMSFSNPFSLIAHCEDDFSRIHPITAGETQGTTTIAYHGLATIADDTGIIFSNLDIKIGTKNLQEHL